MKIRAVTLAMTTALLLSAPAHAQSQRQMNEEAAQNYRKADQKLNLLYQQLVKAYDPKAKDLLVKSQRAWLGFRDAECKLSSSAGEGGSIYPMLNANCLAELTELRIKDLNYLLSCKEGDFSCPQVLDPK